MEDLGRPPEDDYTTHKSSPSRQKGQSRLIRPATDEEESDSDNEGDARYEESPASFL